MQKIYSRKPGTGGWMRSENNREAASKRVQKQNIFKTINYGSDSQKQLLNKMKRRRYFSLLEEVTQMKEEMLSRLLLELK